MVGRLNDASAKHPTAFELAVFGWAWGNTAWAAGKSYLQAALHLVDATEGPVLECGSGLSTLLVGAALAHQNRRLVSLEHDRAWYLRLCVVIERYRLTNIDLRFAPLRDFGTYAWYDPEALPAGMSFQLVLCDGPPGKTAGGRYGLVPLLGERLARNAVILLDDFQRSEDRRVALRWAAEWPAVVTPIEGAPDLALIRHRHP